MKPRLADIPGMKNPGKPLKNITPLVSREANGDELDSKITRSCKNHVYSDIRLNFGFAVKDGNRRFFAGR